MKLLWIVILLDCISTYFIIEIKGGSEINPIISWMIPYIGVAGMLIMKLIITYFILSFLKFYCISKACDYNKFARYIAYMYISIWTIVTVLANFG